jgi:Asp-tRNA(Asn)/Glu-tRNA(Gln) amidotransferase A subunit family amidase
MRPMESSDLSALTASEAASRMQKGEITSEELVRACLDVVEAREDEIGAWTCLDPDYALKQAREADAVRRQGRAVGRLHGVPVGIKDIIETEDMPTENGSPVFAGRQTGRDAAVVSRLREAGAVIMGKTVTTELAVYHPGKTRNPHRPTHTPGGSSSGSAAAVAAQMVPLALGTQTNGSVVRPAAFCGVFGLKPTFGLISRRHVLVQSPPLDTVGMFARSVEDLALAADVLSVYDETDSAMWRRSRGSHHAVAMSEPPLPPVLGFVKGPVWHEAAAITQEAFAELAQALGVHCEAVELPPSFDNIIQLHADIMLADIAKNFGPLEKKAPDKLSERLRAMIEQGRLVSAVAYNEAREQQQLLYRMLESDFERYAALLTPATQGPAPEGIGSTGSPAFCTPWTFLGTPAVSLPLLEADGLPLGVQLVGPSRDDARLLRTARWLVGHLAEGAA